MYSKPRFLRRFHEGVLRFPIVERLAAAISKKPQAVCVWLSGHDYIAYLIEMARLGEAVSRRGAVFNTGGRSYLVKPSPTLRDGEALVELDPDDQYEDSDRAAVRRKLESLR